jgi:hypothetical protein
MRVLILGFENNAGQPLLQSGMFVDVMADIIKLQKERQLNKSTTAAATVKNRTVTPERQQMKKGNAQASVNPESNKKSEGVGAAGGKEGIEKGVHQRLVYKDK